MQTAMAQGQMSQNLAWNNRVQSMQDDIDLYTYINGRNLATNERIGNETQEYQMAKQTYEAGFMAFLGTKFSSEYVNSPDGKVAAENLLATIRKSKEYIQSQIKAKEEKVNTLLELMESDPEMKKRFDELMLNKTAK